MPKLREDRSPSYRLHAASGRAVVTLPTADGGKRDIYLGPHESPESHQNHAYWIQFWKDNGRVLPVGSDYATVTKLAFKFLDWAESHYLKSGRPTNTLRNYRLALERLCAAHGQLLVEEFDVRALADYVARLEESGLARPSVNKDLGQIRRVFSWGATRGLVEPEQALALKLVERLRKGRTKAPEGRTVRAVGADEFRATIARVPAVVRDMALVQWLSGMRPGEVCRMRPAMIDRTAAVWVYFDAEAKLAHLDEHDRLIALNASAQAILQPYLEASTDPEAPLFPPLARAKYRRRAQAWSVDAYGEALERGWLRWRQVRERDWRDPVKRPGLEARHGRPWRPNRIRHAAAVAVQRADGREAARIVLGHGDERTTVGYAKADLERLRASSAALEDPAMAALARD